MSTPPTINKLKAAMHGMAGQPAHAGDLPAANGPDVIVGADRPPSRRGKRVVSAYVDAIAAKQLRLLAAERDTSTQALVEEALNDLFRKHNKSAIA